jgi:FAD binding domain/Domain of unknown function (DUF4265)
MGPTPAPPGEADDDRPLVEVRFHLPDAGGWPPCPIEAVTALLVGPDRARLVDIPVYADGISAGDLVSVALDGAAYVGRDVLSRGRHTTARAAATDTDQLERLRTALVDAGANTRLAERPPTLAVDVPPEASLEHVLVVLDSHSSLTLTYTISCRQHRIGLAQRNDFGLPADLVACDPAGSLEAELRGRVVRAGDQHWDQARAAWNLAVDQRPALVAEVADAFDVQAVMGFAARHGLRVAPQSSGHGASAVGDLSDAILLRTRRMRAVEVDAERRSVRVEAGALWQDVSEALAPLGLVALAGSAADVGVAGYALGGGYSWLARRYGLASSSITAVELVTGDGRFHRVDADNEPGLFWAVRGAAANVGVVCAMELDVLPIPTAYAGALFFPLARAAEILAAYERWTRDLDERVTSCVRLLRLPPAPDIPEPLRGNAFIVVDGAIDAPAVDAEGLLAPLRELGPVVDGFETRPTSELALIHLDPPGPVPAVGDGMSLDDLTPEAMQVLLAHAGPGVETALLAVDLRHAGGALGRPDPRGGVVDHLPGRFLLFAVGMTPTPDVARAVRQEVTALVAAMQPWAAVRDYANFREVAVAAERLYGDADLPQLRALCAGHDPDSVLISNHPVD